MDSEKFEQYLKGRYLDQLNWYDAKAIVNQQRGNIFQWILIISASLTPVTIAIEFGDPKPHSLKWVALLTSCIVAISASAMKAFQFHEKWVSYRAACERLRSEKFLFEAAVGDYSVRPTRKAFSFTGLSAFLRRRTPCGSDMRVLRRTPSPSSISHV